MLRLRAGPALVAASTCGGAEVSPPPGNALPSFITSLPPSLDVSPPPCRCLLGGARGSQCQDPAAWGRSGELGSSRLQHPPQPRRPQPRLPSNPIRTQDACQVHLKLKNTFGGEEVKGSEGEKELWAG